MLLTNAHTYIDTDIRRQMDRSRAERQANGKREGDKQIGANTLHINKLAIIFFCVHRTDVDVG